MTHLPAFGCSSQSCLELRERQVERDVPVVGSCLGPDGGSPGANRELYALAAVSLPRIALRGYLYVDPEGLLVELLELGELSDGMLPEALRDASVPALEGNVHLAFPLRFRGPVVGTRPADLVFVPTSAC